MAIEIRQHVPGKDLRDFMRVPHLLFAGDPVWVPPLDRMVRDQLSPGRNPFLEHAEVALFTAHRHGALVGRISAQIDREHQKRYSDALGFFGFFDTIDDLEVARSLLHAARTWLAARGIRRMRGPLSFSIHEEVGVLVDGFDTPPMVRMGHHKRYQGALLENCGLTKVKDLHAWRYRVQDLPPPAEEARAEVAAMSEVRLRTMDPARLERELRAMLQIQDEARRDSWGHVSLTTAEGNAMVSVLKRLVEPQLAVLADIDGKTAGMAIALPNLYEATAGLRGKLWPLGWAKLLYRLKVQHVKTARLCMFGIKQRYCRQRRYGALALAMVAELHKRGGHLGIEWGELSGTFDNDAPVHLLIRSLRGELYKTYRLYEHPISAAVG